MSGVHAALLTAGALTFLAAIVAFVGLRNVHVRPSEESPRDPAAAAMVEA